MKNIGFLILVILSVSSAWAAPQPHVKQVKEANELFKQEQFDQAIDLYMNALEQNKDTDLVQYNLGSAFYKKGNYDQSIEHLQKAISSKKKDLSAKSYYNLGNALYKRGHSLENTKIDDAISSLQKSLENYNQTLSLNAKDEDAEYNRKFVEKELDRLKKKKEEQQKEQNQPSKDNQSQKDQPDQPNKKDQDKKEDQAKDSSSTENKEEENKSKDQKEQDKQKAQDKQEQTKEAGQKQGQQLSEEKQSLEQRQAKEFLEEYERQDAPKGIFNFMERRQGDDHVDKDW